MEWVSLTTQGEVDFVKIDPGVQRPVSALEVKWSDGPFDHPAELKEAVAFAKMNNLKRLTVTSRSQKGTKFVDNVELKFIPTACFAYDTGKTQLVK